MQVPRREMGKQSRKKIEFVLREQARESSCLPSGRRWRIVRFVSSFLGFSKVFLTLHSIRFIKDGVIWAFM